ESLARRAAVTVDFLGRDHLRRRRRNRAWRGLPIVRPPGREPDATVEHPSLVRLVEDDTASSAGEHAAAGRGIALKMRRREDLEPTTMRARQIEAPPVARLVHDGDAARPDDARGRGRVFLGDVAIG